MHDHRRTGIGAVPDVGELFGIELDAQQQMHWRLILDNLAEEGLIRNTTGMGYPAATRLPSCERYVEDMRRRRMAPAERRVAAALGGAEPVVGLVELLFGLG
ncbi:hypothetical protein Vqi01_42370 [Micromonospora qiuiae]|uniref:Uncharacterized protein n=1 Tax=Micromonospora qiuiae TaxID=502268 RepID=A0ABQ4JFW4_9ACTN|nr:hypothetical protein [Micromonospora qiuiae]GIJ29075.1 hypothetical protein Vqi01_42370 [Micromonospora qiuiae]